MPLSTFDAAPAEVINAQSLLLVGPKAMADYVQAVASFAQQMDRRVYGFESVHHWGSSPNLSRLFVMVLPDRELQPLDLATEELTSMTVKQ